jgi:hypothetical protein
MSAKERLKNAAVTGKTDSSLLTLNVCQRAVENAAVSVKTDSSLLTLNVCQRAVEKCSSNWKD